MDIEHVDIYVLRASKVGGAERHWQVENKTIARDTTGGPGANRAAACRNGCRSERYRAHQSRPGIINKRDCVVREIHSVARSSSYDRGVEADVHVADRGCTACVTYRNRER